MQCVLPKKHAICTTTAGTASSAPFISRTRIGHKGLIFIAICDQIQYSCLQHVHVMTITEACGKNMSTHGRWWSRGTHFPGECQWTV